MQPRNNPFVIGSLFSILWCERATVARSWQGEWDARRWADYIGFDRQLPRWKMRTRTASRSQLVPGWGEVVSDTNARLGATFATVTDNPPRVGAFRLSDHDCQRRELRLHEMIIVTTGLTVPPLTPGVPRAAGACRLSTAPATPNPERGQVAGHAALSLAGEAPERGAAHAARTEALVAHTSPPDLPDPASAVTTFRAPKWVGKWTDAARTWTTSQQINVQ